MQSFRFHLPTDLRFGEGILNDDTLYDLPYKKVLLVTTKSISSARYGSLETIQGKLEAKGIESVLFDQVTRPLTSKTILDAAALAREHGIDAILAHGGGKVIDAAKVIARMVREKDAFLFGWLTSKLAPPFEHAPMDVIAVPTTLTVVASLNHKVYIYDGSKDRYERLKHTVFTPKTAWVDSTLFNTLSSEIIRNSVSDVFVRAFELIRLDVSPLHADMAKQVIIRILTNVDDAIRMDKQEARSALAYAHVLLGSLYVKKPYFPLHMINDTVQGFHPKVHYGRFLFFAAPTYLSVQAETLPDGTVRELEAAFEAAGRHEGTLADSFNALFTSMNTEGDDMRHDRIDAKYPEDYLVHLKVLFPKFSSLQDQTVYRLIEDTML